MVQPSPMSRRSFLRSSGIALGVASAGPLVITSCSLVGSDGAPPAAPQVVRLFSPSKVIVAGRPQRLPFGIVADEDGIVTDDLDVPVRVLSDGVVIDETVVSSRVITHDHPDGDGSTEHEHSDLARYFALYTTMPEVGVYDLEIDISGYTATLAVQAFSEEEVSVLLPGEMFPPLVTATSADPLDLEVLCTRLPEPCDYHDRTAKEILEAGEPMALLIATPALCATAYCGPVLETMRELHPQFPTVAMVHLEVYRNTESVGFDYTNTEIEPVNAMDQLGLEFEPTLFLVDRDGIVVDRIDNVFDITELEQALKGIA